MTYKLRTKNSCGPDSLAFASGEPAYRVDKAWGIDDIDKFKNIADTPYNHFSACNKLGLKFRIVDANEIMRGKLPENKVVVLLHSKNHPTLVQHWGVVYKTGYDCVYVWFGDDKPPKTYTFAAFKSEYTRGFPNCAYALDPINGTLKLTWYQRLYAYISGKFV